MTNEEARKILMDAFNSEDDTLDHTCLSAPGGYLYLDAGRAYITIEGVFTADKVEVISAWMRDPKGVFPGHNG